MLTQMILKSTDFVDLQILPSCVITCLHVSMRFRRGWRPIGCSWIKPRPRSSGVHHHVDNIRSHPIRSTLAALTCSQLLRFMTLGSISTLIWPSGHTSHIVRACFAALHQIRSVQQSLSPHALLTLARALIVGKVDYYALDQKMTQPFLMVSMSCITMQSLGRSNYARLL